MLNLFGSRPSFFNKGFKIASLKFGGTLPVDRDVLIMFVINGRTSDNESLSKCVGSASS